MEKVTNKITLLKMPPFGPPAWEVSNVYFVGEKEVVIIDAGYQTRESAYCILDTWRSMGRPPVKAILITHAHMDHAGALAALVEETGAPVRMHELELKFLGGMFPAERVAGTIGEGDEIEVDGMTFKVLHIPGHTPGHLCFFDDDGGILFTGDQIVGKGYAVIMPPHGNMAEYMAGLKRISRLKLQKLLPGHGPPVDDPDAKIREYMDHRVLREIQILRHIEEGRISIPQMADDIYSDMHPVLRHAGQYQILSHLVKMEAEGMVKCEEGLGIDARFGSLVGKLPF